MKLFNPRSTRKHKEIFKKKRESTNQLPHNPSSSPLLPKTGQTHSGPQPPISNPTSHGSQRKRKRKEKSKVKR
jgi:hypothetical protein